MENKTVLIIEDEPSLSEAVETALSSIGCKIVVRENGKDGLDYALSEHPDLLLLDQNMPVMDGLTVLEKLREDTAWGAQARVIVMTNVNDVDTMNGSMSLGVTEYVLKSEMKLAEIVTMVQSKLNDGQA